MAEKPYNDPQYREQLIARARNLGATDEQINAALNMDLGGTLRGSPRVEEEEEEEVVSETPEESPSGRTQYTVTPKFLGDLPKDREVQQEGFGKLVGRAREMDDIGMAIIDKVMRPDYEKDPDFRFDERLWSEVTKGIHTDNLEAFYDADSQEEAYGIRQRLLREQENQQALAENGWSGLGASLLATMADPVAVGAVALTEGAAAPYVLSAKASRLQRAVRAAFVGAGTEGALESFNVSERYTKGLTDVMFATAFGGTLGGAFGALSRPYDGQMFQASRRLADRAVDEEAKQLIADATSAPIDAVQAAIRQGRGFERGRQEEIRRMADDFYETSKQRRQAEAELREAQEELDAIRGDSDVDYLYRQFGDDIEALEKAKGIGQKKTKVDNFGDLRNAAENSDLDRLYRALTPERKNPIGKKEAQKIKQRIDKSIDVTLRQRDFRRAELEGKVRDLDARASDLKRLVADKQNALINRRGRQGPDIKVTKDVEEKVIGGTKKPDSGTPHAPASKPDTGPFDDSVGAARADDAEVYQQRHDDFINEDKVIRQAQEENDVYGGNARISLSGRLQNAKAAAAQFFGREILSDPVSGDTGRNLAGRQVRQEQVVEASAAETGDRMFMVAGHRFVNKAVTRSWNKYAKRELGLGAFKRNFASKARESFMTDVTSAVRTGSRDYPEEVLQAAEAVRELHDTFLRWAKEANLAGFDDVVSNSKYIHRMYKREKVRALNQKHGDEAVRGLIRDSLIRGARENGEEMPDEVADKIAKAVHKRFSDPAQDFDGLSFNLAFHTRDLDQVEKVLTEGTDLPKDDVDFVLRYLRAEEKADGKSGTDIKYAKRRLELDETTTYTTKEGVTLRFDDMTENNAELLAMRYARSMSGHIAFAKKIQPFLREEFGDDYVRHGVRTDLEMDKLIKTAVRQANRNGMSDGDVERMVKRMKMGYNMLTGRPPTASTESDMGRAIRFVRDWNFVRLMGQVGAAQLAELGPIFGQIGMGLAFRNLGVMRRLWKNRQTGEFTEPMLRELEEAEYVMGVEREVFQPGYKMEDYGLESTRADNWLQRADVGMQQLTRAVSDVSGMSGITAFLQRYASMGAAHKFLKMAKAGQMDTNRMRTLGLTDEMQERVMEQLRKNAGKVAMESGRKADVLNLKSWDDGPAKEAFVNAMYRWSSRMVQRNFIGEMPGWMNTPLGQIMGQFRSFVFTAYEKQLLQGLNAADRQTALSFMWSMTFGGAAYMAQTYLNSMGRDDQDDYLEERLSPANLGLSAFQRAGFASILPGIVDTGNKYLNPMLDEGIFSYGRSTGLATNFITGNPTYNLATSLSSLVTSTIRTPRDDWDFSGTDVRNAFGVAAFGNMWGMRNLEAMIAEDKPWRNTNDPRGLDDFLR